MMMNYRYCIVIILYLVISNCLISQPASFYNTRDQGAGLFTTKKGPELFYVSIIKRHSKKKFRVDTILYTLYNDTMGTILSGRFVDDHFNLNDSYDFYYYKVTVQDSLLYLHKYLRPYGNSFDDCIDGFRTVKLKTGEVSEYQMILDGKIIPINKSTKASLRRDKKEGFHYSTQNGVLLIQFKKTNVAISFYDNNGALLWENEPFNFHTKDKNDVFYFKIDERNDKLLMSYQIFTGEKESKYVSDFSLYRHILIDKNSGKEISKFESKDTKLDSGISGLASYITNDKVGLVYTNDKGIHLIKNIDSITRKTDVGIDAIGKRINYFPTKVINTIDGLTYVFTIEYLGKSESFKDLFFGSPEYARLGYVIFIFNTNGKFLKKIDYFGDGYFNEPILLEDQMTVSVSKSSFYGNGFIHSPKDLWIDYLEIKGGSPVTNNKKIRLSKYKQYFGYIPKLRKAVFLTYSRKNKFAEFQYEQIK